MMSWLIDVRDPHEWDISVIDGTLANPQAGYSAGEERHSSGTQACGRKPILKEIPKDKTLYLHCRSGKRSADSIAFLSESRLRPGKDVQRGRRHPGLGG